MNWFKRLLGWGDAPATARQTLTDAIFDSGACPVCHNEASLLSGPEGGMSVNVMCEVCGTRLNLTSMLKRVEWTHGPQPDIWGGGSATMSPMQDDVELAKRTLEG